VRGGRKALPLAALGALFGGALAVAVTFALSARAQQLVADLSSHLIAITTGFSGTEVVLFGSTDGQGDVAVVVTGPRSNVRVRRKDRIAGIWINRESVLFEQVPSYYVVATNRRLESLAPESVLERHQIGTAHLRLDTSDLVGPLALGDFREALIRNKQRAGQYGLTHGQVTFLGERLFRTNIYFPANVPTGLYNVEVFLIRGGEVVSAQTTPLVVSKVGFSAEVFDFARSQPLTYGVVAVFGAIAAGWLAGAMFRRV